MYSFVIKNWFLAMVTSLSVGFSMVITLLIDSLTGLTSSIFSIRTDSEA